MSVEETVSALRNMRTDAHLWSQQQVDVAMARLNVHDMDRALGAFDPIVHLDVYVPPGVTIHMPPGADVVHPSLAMVPGDPNYFRYGFLRITGHTAVVYRRLHEPHPGQPVVWASYHDALPGATSSVGPHILSVSDTLSALGQMRSPGFLSGKSGRWVMASLTNATFDQLWPGQRTVHLYVHNYDRTFSILVPDVGAPATESPGNLSALREVGPGKHTLTYYRREYPEGAEWSLMVGLDGGVSVPDRIGAMRV